MKNLKKFIFTLILLCFLISDTYSQNDSLNIIKYWHYRKRLEYFVIPGVLKGESQIAGIRNRPDYGANDLNYGQHSIYFGYYLGMLATEYQLLQKSNDTINAFQTKKELNLALMQFVNYMDKCEHLLYKNIKDTCDGFYIRYNVPCNFLDDTNHRNYFNSGLSSDNIFNYESRSFNNLPKGHPAWVGKVSECDSIPQVFSQDEAIGLLLGLALVYKCMPESSVEKLLAQNIAGNVINYIRNSSYKYGKKMSLRWNIFKPNGKKLKINEGGFSFIYAHGFMKSALFFNIKNDNLWNKFSRYFQEILFQSGQFIPNPNPDNNSMISTLAVIGDSWRATVPFFGLIFHINTTYFGLKNKTTNQDWDSFYILLWDVLHNKHKIITKRMSKALEQLNKAPFEGPYNYGNGNNPVDTGWSASYKFHLKKKVQNGKEDGILGNYNGLDYMLLHNLYCLTNGIQLKR